VTDERPLSTGDIARLLHVTAVAVLRWIRAGKVKAYRVPGGRYRIARDEFRKFLATIDQQVPDELAVHLVLDNSSTHKTPAIRRWLLAHPRFVLHFTPTSASCSRAFSARLMVSVLRSFPTFTSGPSRRRITFVVAS